MSDSVNGRTHGRRLESHPISSPRAFGSGELKSKASMTRKYHPPSGFKVVVLLMLMLIHCLLFVCGLCLVLVFVMHYLEFFLVLQSS